MRRVPRARSPSGRAGHPYLRGCVHTALAAFVFALLKSHFSGREDASVINSAGRKGGSRVSVEQALSSGAAAAVEPVLVSYSYFEKDDVQRANFEFFIAVGMGVDSSFMPPHNTDFTVVVSGSVCTPCQTLRPALQPVPSDSLQPGITKAMAGPGLTILYRSENVGMDIAAHNTTLQWTAASSDATKYKHYIFLNSSIRGPFLPSYVRFGFQWTQAFTRQLSDTVKVVASSLVCLPEVDVGGPGPRVESWAYATDTQGLVILQEAGTFWTHECKKCDNGIVVMGEYGITKALMDKGFNIATLMSRYANGTDWRDRRHWQCNNSVHPSRSGTYDGITMHPFETVFVKASWHVGEPFTSHYTRWFQEHAQGQAGTQGSFDEKMYRYAVSDVAQEPRDREHCYSPNT